MAGYGKQFFDVCLAAIVGELERLEETHPDWPDDPARAATLVSEKADELLLTSANRDGVNARHREHILEGAVQTGALALRFLLAMNGEVELGGESSRPYCDCEREYHEWAEDL